MRQSWIFLVGIFATAPSPSAAQKSGTTGPPRGTLLLDGGGAEGIIRREISAMVDSGAAANDAVTGRNPIIRRFVQLAGGPRAIIVVIPTAWDDEHTTPEKLQELRKAVKRVTGVDRVTLLHTRYRRQADTPTLVAPLRTATAVWIDGGQDAQLWETYVGTRVEAEVKSLLARGGVVAGTSAGAVIESSLGMDFSIVDSLGPQSFRVNGTHACWGLLANSTILPHWSQRGRPDLTGVVRAHPGLLGIGIDERAAIEVRGDQLEVIGDGHVGVFDGRLLDGKSYVDLSSGDRFDLLGRRILR